MSKPFLDESADPGIRGFLHLPSEPNGEGVVLTHGAGSNCQTRLLVEVAGVLSAMGFAVLRFDLPFRLARQTGPPRPGDAERDRDGLRRATSLLRAEAEGRLFVGGHSYGGRQASMLVAEEPAVADGLLLLSYPLHPPKKPMEVRTKHFPRLSRPAFFAHGTRDGFGSIPEMEKALQLIPAEHALFPVDRAGHDLAIQRVGSQVAQRIAEAFTSFVGMS
jgi:predicted alpha/beta-hydrolase family hydrolase